MNIYVVRCVCGKVHAAAGISVMSVCTCDRFLLPQVFGEKDDQTQYPPFDE